MTRVLVPVAILKGEAVSTGLIELLGSVDVTVLGYHVIPEQTPPDQARAQFEERANDALEDIVAEFESAGSGANHRLVFTQERRKTINRLAEETDSKAYAITGATGKIDDLLVTLTGNVDTERIVDFVTTLINGRDVGVTLFAVGEADGRLDTASERLSEAGIETAIKRATGDPFDALIETIPGHDAVVMGERAPSLGSLLFGEEAERVATASVGPVLVVRSETQPETMTEKLLDER